MPDGLEYVNSWIEVGMERCFQVIELLAEDAQPVRLGVISERLGLQKGAVHRLLASQLEMFMFDTIDGTAFTAVTLLMIAAAAGAAFFPSRRAARIEPVSTLRYD